MDASDSYRIVPMESRHGEEVGRLHAEQIEYSHMTGLGADFLGRLYESLIEMEFGIGYVLVRDSDPGDGGEVAVGFSYGRVFPSAPMTRVVLRSWRRLLAPLLWMPFTRPAALFHTLHGMLQSDDIIGEPGVGEWLAIALHPDARGGGNGPALVRPLFAEIAARGCDRVRTAAHGGNERIVRFFEEMGGRRIRETRVSGAPVLWFEFDLVDR